MITGMEDENEETFSMKYKDFELRSCPKHLIRLCDDEPDVTIDFIKWNKSRKTCYSIGYFYYNDHEPCWELKFVGDRFLEVSQEDIKIVWNMFTSAYKCLEEWSCINDDRD